MVDFFEDEKISFIVQRQGNSTENGIGGISEDWVDYVQSMGILDSLSGGKKEIANKLTEQSTHILICPVLDILKTDRIKINNLIYTIDFIDNPLNLNDHFEIYLGLVT